MQSNPNHSCPANDREEIALLSVVVADLLKLQDEQARILIKKFKEMKEVFLPPTK